jgi:hypothetical protein
MELSTSGYCWCWRPHTRGLAAADPRRPENPSPSLPRPLFVATTSCRLWSPAPASLLGCGSVLLAEVDGQIVLDFDLAGGVTE